MYCGLSKLKSSRSDKYFAWDTKPSRHKPNSKYWGLGIFIGRKHFRLTSESFSYFFAQASDRSLSRTGLHSQVLLLLRHVVRMEEAVAEFGSYLLQLFLMCIQKELTTGKFSLVIKIQLVRIQLLRKPWKDLSVSDGLWLKREGWMSIQ